MMKKINDQFDHLFYLTKHPTETKESPDTFHGNLQDWTEKMVSETKKILPELNRPTVILLAGPSCGGKTEAVERLEKSLNRENIQTVTFSTDNFYRGITDMVFNPIFQNKKDFTPQQTEEITDDIRHIIKKSPFNQKFCQTNLEKISRLLEQKHQLNQEFIQKILDQALTEFNQLDFDHPSAVNLDQVKKVIQALKNNQSVIIPEYSMKYSEPDGQKEINPQNYQAIICEGTFALNQLIESEADLKTFIKTPDQAHLLLRRLYRDVIGKNARSSFTPETALMINLRIVMPAARKHVLPTENKAAFVCENPHTLPEAVNTSYCEVQDKIKVSQKELPNIWRHIIQSGYEIIHKSTQKDYYIVDKHKSAPDQEDYQKYILRLREEDEKLELVYKGPRFLNPKNKIIRPAEVLVKKDDFGTHYQTTDQLLTDFKKSGFKTLGTISKKRILCRQNDIIIAIDQVDKLGYFIEFITDNENQIPAINQLKKELGLEKHPSYGPYIDQLIMQQY